MNSSKHNAIEQEQSDGERVHIFRYGRYDHMVCPPDTEARVRAAADRAVAFSKGDNELDFFDEMDEWLEQHTVGDVFIHASRPNGLYTYVVYVMDDGELMHFMMRFGEHRRAA